MTIPSTRRHFLKSAAAGASMLGLGDGEAFRSLGLGRAADLPAKTDRIRFSADIEPLVRLIEEKE